MERAPDPVKAITHPLCPIFGCSFASSGCHHGTWPCRGFSLRPCAPPQILLCHPGPLRKSLNLPVLPQILLHLRCYSTSLLAWRNCSASLVYWGHDSITPATLRMSLFPPLCGRGHSPLLLYGRCHSPVMLCGGHRSTLWPFGGHCSPSGSMEEFAPPRLCGGCCSPLGLCLGLCSSFRLCSGLLCHPLVINRRPLHLTALWQASCLLPVALGVSLPGNAVGLWACVK